MRYEKRDAQIKFSNLFTVGYIGTSHLVSVAADEFTPSPRFSFHCPAGLDFGRNIAIACITLDANMRVNH